MIKIAIVGMPNAGKSTLINSLTGSDLKVGNWHGVTVAAKECKYFYEGEEYVAVDLPGVYDLAFPDAEERVTAEFLAKKEYALIAVVIEANKLESGVSLIKSLAAYNKPIVAFINLYADFLKRGGHIDLNRLSEKSGVVFFGGDADKRKDASAFKKVIKAVAFQKTTKIKGFSIESEDYTPFSRQKRFSDLFFNPLVIYSSFILFVCLSVWLAFGRYGVGEIISGAIGRLFEVFKTETSKFLERFCSPFIAGLVSNGVIGGIGAVAEFIPALTILSLATEFAEQSGYMSRLAVAADGIMRKVGLNGKAVYALFSGYGCTAVSASLCEGIEDGAVKRRTVLSLPFMSCSAKTPIYALVAANCFGKFAPIVIISVYFCSVFFSLIHSAVLYKTVFRKDPESLIMEMAEMRMVKTRQLFRSAKRTIINFTVRLGTVIVLSSVALFLLGNVSVDFAYTPSGENSVLSLIGRAISPLFKPMGLSDWRFSVAFITGIFAKEGVAASLGILFPKGLGIGIAEGIAFTVFCYAYTPCVAAIGAIGKSIGKRYAVFAAVWQFVVALLFGYAAYFVFHLLLL